MTPDAAPYPFPSIPRPVRHFVALAAVVIAVVASRTTWAVDEGGLFLIMSITVVAAAWFAGVGSALAVTVLGAVLAAVGREGNSNVAVHLHHALFIVEGLLLTALVAELRRGRGGGRGGGREGEGGGGGG